MARPPPQPPVTRPRAVYSTRRMDDVARDHRLARRGTRADVHERLARVDGNSHLQIRLLSDPFTDRKRGAHGPFGIILVGHRRAEDGHHRVPDELLDRAAMPLELRAKASVIGRKHSADILRIELLGLSGE